MNINTHHLDLIIVNPSVEVSFSLLPTHYPSIRPHVSKSYIVHRCSM